MRWWGGSVLNNWKGTQLNAAKAWPSLSGNSQCKAEDQHVNLFKLKNTELWLEEMKRKLYFEVNN